MAEVDVGAVAPVAPVVPASTDAPASESTAEPIVESPEGGEPDKPERTFTQRELDEIVQKRLAKDSKRSERLGEERARREAAERELERMRAERAPQNDRPRDGEPRQENFKDYEKYVVALAKYELKQEQTARDNETAAQRQHSEMVGRAEQARTALSKAAEKYDDFEEVVTGNVPFTEPMTAYIAEAAKDGGELAYYLGTHVEEAKRIAALKPALQIVEMHALESKLTAPPKPTNTPAPIVPNKGSSAGSKSMLDMTQDEFEKHRKARLARK